MRWVRVASGGDGARWRLILDPGRVGRACTSNRVFTAYGTPASGPGFRPAVTAASTARAFARARSAVTSVNEFNTGLCLAIRASAASVTLRADIFRPVTACAIFEAESPSPLADMTISGGKDTGRLGFVRQHKFGQQPRQRQRHIAVVLDGRLP